MSTEGTVHVGDTWQTYKAKVQDDGVPFDMTTATTKTLIFWTPAGVLERAATVSQEGAEFYLSYALVPVTDAAFHARPGVYRWQGYLVFADGRAGKTNIESYIVLGNLN